MKSLTVVCFSGYLKTTLKNLQLTLVSKVVSVLVISIMAGNLFKKKIKNVFQ